MAVDTRTAPDRAPPHAEIRQTAANSELLALARTDRAAKIAETDHLAVLFVPECQAERFHAELDCHHRRFVKERIFIVRFLESVVRNAGAKVVHMVQANVSGEPL